MSRSPNYDGTLNICVEKQLMRHRTLLQLYPQRNIITLKVVKFNLV